MAQVVWVGTAKLKRIGRPPLTRKRFQQFIKWFRYLASEAYFSDVSREFQKAANRKKLKQIVRMILLKHIYAAYEPEEYQRSYALLESFLVAAGSEDKTGITIYSDPYHEGGRITRWNLTGTAEAIGAGHAGESYAAFFERIDFKSFIPDHAEPFRPFMGEMTIQVANHTPTMLIEAFIKKAKAKQPKS